MANASATATSAFAQSLMPENNRGAAMGLYRSIADMGQLFAPPLLGYLADTFSIQHALVFNGIGVVVIHIFFYFGARQHEAAEAAKKTQ